MPWLQLRLVQRPAERRSALVLAITQCEPAPGQRDHLSFIQIEASLLHLIHDFDTAKSFVAWINACPENEILYQPAMDVRMAHYRAKSAANPVVIDPEVSRQAIEDLYAAVRVLK